MVNVFAHPCSTKNWFINNKSPYLLEYFALDFLIASCNDFGKCLSFLRSDNLTKTKRKSLPYLSVSLTSFASSTTLFFVKYKLTSLALFAIQY